MSRRAVSPRESCSHPEIPAASSLSEMETAMFKNVLVGVDGTSQGQDAITLASALTASEGKLTLAHVHPGALNLSGYAPVFDPEEGKESQALLDRERKTADVTADLLSIPSTSAGQGLHEQAEKLDADLLVVGSCSHGLLGRAALGDHTRSALDGAPCAVAIASRGYAKHAKPIASVGVAYNASPESKAALNTAQELAAEHKATVSALEVVSIPSYATSGLVAADIGEGIVALLDDANTRMRQLDDVDGHAVYGIAGEELAAFGARLDLLVVGSRSYGPWRRLVLGSTSDYLERHARCSLLVLPRAATVSESRARKNDRTLELLSPG
jgi:nucleotide-binding universal stress UspA family protein